MLGLDFVNETVVVSVDYPVDCPVDNRSRHSIRPVSQHLLIDQLL